MIGDKYYLGGLSFDSSFKSVTFVEILGCSYIENNNGNLTIYYKTGTNTDSLSNILIEGVEIHKTGKTLQPYRLTKLTPRVIKLNEHYVDVYDLDNRVLNYLVTHDRANLVIEDFNTTTFVLHKSAVDPVRAPELEDLLNGSLYFKYRTYPYNEFNSFYLINTSTSTSEFLSERDSPLYFSKYAEYRIEYSKYLLGFYEELQKALPDFFIYLANDKLTQKEVSKSNRISINFDNLGNLQRHPYMNDPDIIDAVSTISLRFETNDQLKYQFIRDSYQNLTCISNIARYSVKDVHGFPWMAHVEWEPARDNVNMKTISDEEGRFSFVFNVSCNLHYYIVRDKLYNMILLINTRYETFTDGKGLNLLIT